MVVRTSYSGMQESVHNKTVDPATSFSFHCPSYQYPIFTGMHEFPYFLLSYNYNRKSKFFSLFILPFFFNVTFIKLLLPLFFVSIYLQLQSKVKILLILYFFIFFSMLLNCYFLQFIKLLLSLSFVSVSYIYQYVRISPLIFSYLTITIESQNSSHSLFFHFFFQCYIY